MTLTCWDSTNAHDIPATAQVVAGYCNGDTAWDANSWAIFDHLPTLRIDVLNEDAGNVLDVERGDATPQDAPRWVNRCRARGLPPVVYCSRAAWPAVIAEFVRTGVPQPFWWVADWTGHPHQVSPPASAVQYANPASGSGGHFDLSIVYDERMLQPPVIPAPAPTGPHWILQYIPAGVPLPTTIDKIVTVTVQAPDAASGEAMIPSGATLFAIHGPLS